MGEFSIWHWLIVLAVVLLLFGGNKMSTLMGDFAKGIKAFKKNMADEADAREVPRLEVAESVPAPVRVEAAASAERVAS